MLRASCVAVAIFADLTNFRCGRTSTWMCFRVLSVILVLVSFMAIVESASKKQLKCVDVTVEEGTRTVEVTVSGTVKKLMTRQQIGSPFNNLRYSGLVEVKRVFKGDKLVNAKGTLTPGLFRQHRMVLVQGFGDPLICGSQVRERETKIFMLSVNDEGEFQLEPPILALTLRNLDYVDAVVRNIPFVAEKAEEISPCFLYFCPFGATCHVNQSDQSPMCVCQQRCSKVFAPVCGSDGVSYSNLCMLERASCIHNRKVNLVAQGQCGIRNPCEGQVCRFGAECMPSIDGTMARCQCPLDCPTFGDSVDSKPVCGNDGNNYANLCELRKTACYKLEDIRVKYYGRCDPCEGFLCEAPKVCQVNAQREPECRCSYICPTDMNLVCGTDGRTYSNQCLLRKQACKSMKDIKVLYSGKCSPDTNPCSKVQCGPEEECSVDRAGRAACVCPPVCEPVLRRVCGNDSTTYDNDCELRRRSCLEKVYVVVKHPGPCGQDFLCHGHFCDFGAVCVERNGKPECQCPQCTEEYSPVCGENGITYDNECKLRQENCHREENIKIKKEGTCDGCGQQRCEFYAVCESVGGRPRCKCPESCVEVDSPVCGNDGVTYTNECHLRTESCRTKKLLTISSTGSCDKCKSISCEFNAKCENGMCVCPILCPTIHQPVCGTDDRSYINECEMRKYSCNQRVLIVVAKIGECEGDFLPGSGDEVICGDGALPDDEVETTVASPSRAQLCTQDNCIKFGGVCQREGARDKCVCQFQCEAVRQPVCGSDGQIYGSRCTMQRQSCLARQLITEQRMDNCDEFDEQEACDGSPPLVNSSSGKELACGPGRELCPPNSYCHITPQFSKCCREELVVVKTRNCSGSRFGCCSDRVTPARGPGASGCPEMCRCNPVGSYSSTCDPVTRQCTCKPGVVGKMCDHCNSGYWGLSKVGEAGNVGCIPCGCNKFGSHRDDCEQMTGRCMCKAHVTGMKCDMCHNGNLLGPDGCRDQFPPDSCDDLVCFHGSTCQDDEDGNPLCVCEQSCDSSVRVAENVCGTDGQNYGSKCQLELFGCRMQKDIAVAYSGFCKGGSPTPMTTSSPVTKSRKTTRDIDVPEDSYNLTNNTHRQGKPPIETGDQKCTGSRIDELCLSNDDCCPNFSLCRNGLCYCSDGYTPSPDSYLCLEVKTTPAGKVGPQSNACSSSPCPFGQCVLDEMLGYRCACPLGREGPLCDRISEFTVPSFSGKSHLELKRIEKASQDLSLEISFSTLNKNGIILFSARHSNGSGDFVSLAVKDGFLEFRYDLGAGPAVLRSLKPIELIKYHQVTARRVKEVGQLFVDSEEPVSGSSPPSHTSLELDGVLYLGFIPEGTKEAYDKVGVSLGLAGCVHSLRAGSRDDMYTYNLALHSSHSDVLRGTDIFECGRNPCQSMPCRNGATCLLLDAQIFECRCKNGYKGSLCEELTNPCAAEPCQFGGTCIPITGPDGFFCQCAQGREGVKCEKEAMPEVFVPQFTGDSYMEMPLEEKLSSSMSITVWFKSLKPDGVLFFVTQRVGGQGDFIALNLDQKKLVFTFFLGSGIGHIESKKHIHLDKWHKVTVKQSGRVSEVSVDGHPPVTGESAGSASVLNIDNRPLFVGGFRQKEDLPLRARIKSGFTGAIQRIIINGRTIDGLMSSAITMRNISTYNGPPCNVNPCLHGGVCVPMLSSAECRCPASFMGERCEQKYEQRTRDAPVKFDGLTFLSYPNEVSHRQEGQQANRFVISFRTTHSDGILLLQTDGGTTASDFLSVAVQGGQVEFSYNLGKQSPDKLLVLRSMVKVADDKWHTAKVARRHQEGSLQVDDEEPIISISESNSQQLDTDGLLWVGGRNNIPSGLTTRNNFNGCVDFVQVNGIQLHLVADETSHKAAVTFCT